MRYTAALASSPGAARGSAGINMFAAMQFTKGILRLIDQRLLPQEEVWLECRGLESVALAIEDMVIRGAPAIGCAAAYGLALDVQAASLGGGTWDEYRARFHAGISRLARTRPTAVNLFYALDHMRRLGATLASTMSITAAAEEIVKLAEDLAADDLKTCQAIGAHGAKLAEGRKLRILTHCNTGSLATAGYGTALGVIRSLHAAGQVELVYADETRPYLQGSRLTAFELRSEGIPYKVITDSAAAYLMQLRQVDWVIVGADRIAANGDTANKIGTYGLAVQCRHHGIPFYVAAPLATFDTTLATGAEIPVEERSPDEIRYTGGRQMTPVDAPVYNPSFDVTPAALIAGLITEKGVLKPPYTESIDRLLRNSN